MHLTLIAALLLSAGPGARFSPGPPVSYGRLSGAFTASTAVGEPTDTDLVLAAGTVMRLHWEATTAGTDNGEGPDSLTLAVTADGTPICSTSISCTTTGDGSASCSGAFTADQDLHLEVTASDCATLPALLVGATWIWE